MQTGKIRSSCRRRRRGRRRAGTRGPRIQLRLPLTVLISPLCATKRYGWASGQLGKVFVEKREWTSATAVAKRRSDRSGKKGSSWPVVSMPL